MVDTVYTIGHSTHPIEKLVELLKSQFIDFVCDVRSRPYSRMNPQFNREQLQHALRDAGIKYVFLGAELGARSEDKTCYRNGRVQYDLLAQTELFKRGIERVKKGASSYKLALMCAEKEPLDCHRTILVGRRLLEEGIGVRHILSDGRVEEHAHAIDRLISKLGLPQDDMFQSKESTVREAYVRQGNDIAYQEQVQESPAADRSSENSVLGAQ